MKKTANIMEFFDEARIEIIQGLIAEMYNDESLIGDVAELLTDKEEYSEEHIEKMDKLDEMFPNKKILLTYLLNELADKNYAYMTDI